MQDITCWISRVFVVQPGRRWPMRTNRQKRRHWMAKAIRVNHNGQHLPLKKVIDKNGERRQSFITLPGGNAEQHICISSLPIQLILQRTASV